MNEPFKRERFGRYLILDHLVDGGMAKICRARFLGEQGDKVVVIKMIQPQYSKDEAFKTMFNDELNLTFGLSHPNVIQTYDYGIHKGQLFVAMEYCEGKNLKEFLDKLKATKVVFPVHIATFIISQACQGLYYAHTFRNKLTGLDAKIIHRDISPHNIMLTYDGSVKIIDFGIAKSKSNSEATIAGTIKGKLSYLAPEYLEGLELDVRYDQFALGITLWEMLCNQKLFKEKNDLAVLKKIQECKIPAPSSINPHVPKELDEIVLKALSKNRANRFENLDQMNRALMKFLYAKFPDFNATDLSYFSQDLFRDEIKIEHEKMFGFGKIDIRPYLSEMKKELEVGSFKTASVLPSNPNIETVTPGVKEQVIIDFGFDKADARPAKTETKKMGYNNNGIKLTANQSLSDDDTLKNISPQSNTNVTNITRKKLNSDHTETKNIKANLDQEPGAKKGRFGKLAAIFALVVGTGAYVYLKMLNEQSLTPTEVSAIHQNIKQRNPAQSSQNLELINTEDANKGNITFSHYNKETMQVFIDGEKVKVELLSSVKVPLGKEFMIRVQAEGRKNFVKEMRVDNTSTVDVEIPDMPAAVYGYLNSSPDCIKGEIRFEIDGEKRSSQVPMVESFGIAFPLEVDSKGQGTPTKYEVFFKRAGEEIERKIDVIIPGEDKNFNICDQL